MMIDEESRGALLRQHLQTTNDVNGNPRRLWLLLDAQTGSIIKVVNEGNRGIPKEWRDVPELPQIDVTLKFYHDALSWAKRTNHLMLWGE